MNFSLIYIEKSVYWDNTAWYGIYLINTSDQEFKVDYTTWWSYSADEVIHTIDSKTKSLGMLHPHSRILVEESDLWQLDIQWYVTLNLTGKNNYHISFKIWKWCPSWESFQLEGFENRGLRMEFDIQEVSTIS